MPNYIAVDLSLAETILLDDQPIAQRLTGDLQEIGGHLWHDGVHKIILLPAARNLGCPFKSKTFKGETAWMDADRLWLDLKFWAQREGAWLIETL
jgi:hypothetical protein